MNRKDIDILLDRITNPPPPKDEDLTSLDPAARKKIMIDIAVDFFAHLSTREFNAVLARIEAARKTNVWRIGADDADAAEAARQAGEVPPPAIKRADM